MSRTDIHRPYRAQLKEHAVARHDHRTGECDLVDLDVWVKEATVDGESMRTQRCWWELPQAFLAEHHICGCPLCTGRFSRRSKQKQERARAKRDIAKALRDEVEE